MVFYLWIHHSQQLWSSSAPSTEGHTVECVAIWCMSLSLYALCGYWTYARHIAFAVPFLVYSPLVYSVIECHWHALVRKSTRWLDDMNMR